MRAGLFQALLVVFLGGGALFSQGCQSKDLCRKHFNTDIEVYACMYGADEVAARIHADYAGATLMPNLIDHLCAERCEEGFEAALTMAESIYEEQVEACKKACGVVLRQ